MATVVGNLAISPRGQLTGRWAVAHERVLSYLRAAGLDEATAAALSHEIVDRCAHAVDVDSTEEAVLMALEAARADLWGKADEKGLDGPLARPLDIRPQELGSVVDWRRAAWRLRRLIVPRPSVRAGTDGERRATALSGQARIRRLAFGVLILATTFWGSSTFLKIVGTDGLSVLDIAHTTVLTVLLLWLSQSFWTLAAGAAVLLARLRRRPQPEVAAAPVSGLQRAALVMPVYNEDPRRVFAGLRAMWEDLAAAGPQAGRLDLFILSDTTDPDVWLAEVEAWQALREAVPGGERIFYRRRLRNHRRKAGNIEDFLARWGSSYAYMLVLDADSLMKAESMLALVARMDANPRVGLIQAPPKLVRGRSLFARMLQTAGELYGPLSASGTSYWAMGEGNYWGHNAIIRIAPWVRLCGLPVLPGKAPLGGEILSHDFVEAALMRRGGWQVWIADDLAGSYEEPPPGMEEFAVRDRRWCQGNMQHMRVLLGRRLHWVSRLHLAIGVMAYLTSPLWLLFLLLAAAQAWELTYGQPVYFIEGWPFPLLPVSAATEAALLLTVTLGLLFVPKLMGLALALLDRERRARLGGGPRLLASALIETVFSALLAPIMMLLHTRFVGSILLGAAIEWTPQKRHAEVAGLRAAIRTFGWVTAVGVAATIAAGVATPILLLWLLPVVAGLWLAVPLATFTVREAPGDWLGRRGLLLVTEETAPPPVLRRLDELLAASEPTTDATRRFVRTVMDPRRNALHLDLLGRRAAAPATVPPLLERKAVFLGPAALDKADRRAILENVALLRRLHLAAWVHWPAQGVSI
jgi:membrane glycosyltransferase